MGAIKKNLQRGLDRMTRLKSRLTGKGYPLRLNEDVAPVFIIGSGRSGSTVLRRILAASDELHIPPEFDAMRRVIRRFMKHSYRPWESICREAADAIIERYDFKDFALEPAEVYERFVNIPEKARSLAALIDAFFTLHAERHGKTRRWADKTPQSAEALPELMEMFPRAKMVHLLRDGIDVVVSFREAGLVEDFRESAALWTERGTVCRELGDQYPDQYREIRYEDMVTQPEKVLPPIFEFLGLTWDPDFIDRTEHVKAMGDVPTREHHKAVFKPLSADSIGKGRRALRPDEHKLLAEVMNEALIRFDYEPLSI
jgi:protein-tyrosine sulfotransferase